VRGRLELGGDAVHERLVALKELVLSVAIPALGGIDQPPRGCR
jgi:hypothetical protein